MGVRDLVEHALGLGRSEDVRRIPVGVARARVDREIRSTPGARLRITRDHQDGETARLLLWCVRNGIPVEIREGDPRIEVDGVEVGAAEARVSSRRPGRR